MSWSQHDFYGMRDFTVQTTPEFAKEKTLQITCHSIEYNEGGVRFVMKYESARYGSSEVIDTTVLFLPYRYVHTIQETEPTTR